jgi:hypothetical protein
VSFIVQEVEDVIFDDEDAFLKRYISASQGTFEFGSNLPRCSATATEDIVLSYSRQHHHHRAHLCSRISLTSYERVLHKIQNAPACVK